MHMACSKPRPRTARCAFGVLRAAILLAFVAPLSSSSGAEAATCLVSAEEVRKVTPKAWPKWTYGPNRERCWYSGDKPVFAKVAPSQAPVPSAPVATCSDRYRTSRRTTGAPSSVKHPWALEYRWSDGVAIRHHARDEPLTHWVGDAPLLHPSQ